MNALLLDDPRLRAAIRLLGAAGHLFGLIFGLVWAETETEGPFQRVAGWIDDFDDVRHLRYPLPANRSVTRGHYHSTGRACCSPLSTHFPLKPFRM